MGNGQQSNVNGRFTDCIGHWAQSDIEEMTKQGIVTGVTVNTFEPDREITRAEFATLVAKALNLTSTASAGFSDVASESWYYTCLLYTSPAGFVPGKPKKRAEKAAETPRKTPQRFCRLL